MATKISWTQETWNPIAGCTMISPGCKNCYAMQMAYRLESMGQAKYDGLTRRVNGRSVWTGEVRLDEKALEIPYRWRKPRKVFVNSMSDLFHERLEGEQIDRIMQVMIDNPKHTFQVLTKRAERMGGYLSDNDLPPNIWFGVSVESQKQANERLEYLGDASVYSTTFVSYEPALGPVDFNADANWKHYINQIIIGGESGPNRRPFDMQWARDTRDYCVEHEIAFFFKQASARRSGVAPYLVEEDGTRWEWHQSPDDMREPVLIEQEEAND